MLFRFSLFFIISSLINISSQEIKINIELESINPFKQKSLFVTDKNVNLPYNTIDSINLILNKVNTLEISDFSLDQNPDQFEISVYNFKENQIDLLNENFSNLLIDNQFISTWRLYLHFKYHDLLSQYIIYNKKSNFKYDEIPYFLSEDLYLNYSHENYDFPIFKDYIYHMTLLMASRHNSISPNKFFINSFIDYAKNNLEENLFVYCSSRFVYEYIETIDDLLFKDFVNQMNNYKSFEFYKTFLIEENEKSIKTLTNNEYDDKFDKKEFSFYLEDLNGNLRSLSEFYGKYLYVDLWASWCGPCKKQFKYVKELKQKFKRKQLKKIKFVYISIDKDYSAWKETIKKYDIEGEHFISPANKLNNASDFFNISSIPRYIVIDPSGKITDSDAIRPGDPDIKEFLLKLID